MTNCLFTNHNVTRFYHNGKEITYADFYALLPGYDYDRDNAVYWERETPDVAPGRTNSRRVVLAHHIDGYVETDEAWLANQEQLDYAATMDAASSREQ